ncbi:DNA glycosylase, partial [Blyttiomyces helicus]
VWISEIMLQQTQVSTVTAYYTRWVARWPTVHDLARASPEEVREMWAGLGYYSRASRLLEGAVTVVKEMGGVLPGDAVGLKKNVGGIGPYTAGAIASIAYNQPEPLVDGNVVRVLSRLCAIGADPKAKDTIALHWSLAEDILDRTHPGDFNQALMDLGATICTPQNPECGKCPVSEHCRALAEVRCMIPSSFRHCKGGRRDRRNPAPCTLCIPVDIEDCGVTRYPLKVKKKAPRDQDCAVCIVQHQPDGGGPPQYLVVLGPETGLLANLWDFP